MSSYVRHECVTNYRTLACSNVNSTSEVEIRVYEKQFLQDKRVGSLEYAVSTVAGQSETKLGQIASCMFLYSTMLTVSTQLRFCAKEVHGCAVVPYPGSGKPTRCNKWQPQLTG